MGRIKKLMGRFRGNNNFDWDRRRGFMGRGKTFLRTLLLNEIIYDFYGARLVVYSRNFGFLERFRSFSDGREFFKWIRKP